MVVGAGLLGYRGHFPALGKELWLQKWWGSVKDTRAYIPYSPMNPSVPVISFTKTKNLKQPLSQWVTERSLIFQSKESHSLTHTQACAHAYTHRMVWQVWGRLPKHEPQAQSSGRDGSM